MRMRWGVLGLSVLALGAPILAQEDAARVLPRPPFAYFSTTKPTNLTKLRLVKSSERRNKITDTEAWFQRNKLTLPNFGMKLAEGDRGRLPADAPESFAEQQLVSAVEGRRNHILMYGPDFAGARYLVGFDPQAGQAAYQLDFRNYVNPPAAIPADRESVDEKIQWAQEADGVLYVSNFHRTYARWSKGKNGYITALDPKTGRIKWRSRPLICNSNNFLVSGDAIITGYGFSAEPDYLYVLDRKSGAVAQTVRVKSGPEHLILKDGKLFVRTYDTDYVFRMKR